MSGDYERIFGLGGLALHALTRREFVTAPQGRGCQNTDQGPKKILHERGHRVARKRLGVEELHERSVGIDRRVQHEERKCAVETRHNRRLGGTAAREAQEFEWLHRRKLLSAMGAEQVTAAGPRS